jgi:small subunit ribosomal protein S18
MMDEKRSDSRPAAPSANPVSSAPGSSAPDSRPPFHRRRPEARRKVCRLCADKVARISYKNAQLLKTFMMDSGKILSRRITGTCAKHQRQITGAIKRNRNIATLPYEVK